MQMLFEKSESHDGGRDTVGKIPMRHRVANDMTISDTLFSALVSFTVWPASFGS